MLCNLTKRPEAALRLNGIWALMNMAFQVINNTLIVNISIETSSFATLIKYNNNRKKKELHIMGLGNGSTLINQVLYVDYVLLF